MPHKKTQKPNKSISQLKTWWEDFKHISYIDARWVAVWLTIYLGFLSLDIVFPKYWGSSLLKYAGIFLCIIYAYRKFHSDNKLIIALLFTFLADTILVWTTNYTMGVFVFCFAQYMHFIRLTKISKKSILIFTATISILIIINAIQGNIIIYPLATLYALLLIGNCITSIQRNHENPNDFKNRCAKYGFILFVLCDAYVALRFLMINGIIGVFAFPLIEYLVWVFYYPSQVLLANSSTHKEKTKSTTVAKTHPIS